MTEPLDAPLEVVARVESERTEPVDDDWSKVAQTIVVADSFGEDALRGIEEYSHLEVLYLFHRVDPAEVERGARRPRGNPAWPEVGIFAQRAKDRPNRIGSTVCRLLERDGRRLRVEGLDCIDGTPVLDVKPYVREFRPRGAYRQPLWVAELMLEYWNAHGFPWSKRVDYETVKAAFSVLPKPLWVHGDSWEIDMDDDDIQRLVDADPDELSAEDFHGYVDTCVSGCIDDFRSLLPPMLRLWEEGLYDRDDAFPENFVDKLVAMDVLHRGLSDELCRVVEQFMKRALSERIARETSLRIVGSQETHAWLGHFREFARVSYTFPELWNTIWSAEERGHAVAVLQYASCFAFEEDDNPIFAPFSCGGGGGPWRPWLTWGSPDANDWIDMNREFVEQTLHVDFLVERMEHVEARWPDDELAPMAARIRERLLANRDAVARRCRHVTSPVDARTGLEGITDPGSCLRELVIPVRNPLSASVFYSVLCGAEIETSEPSEVAIESGGIRLRFVAEPDDPRVDTGLASVGFEVESVEAAVTLASMSGGGADGPVRRVGGRLEATVIDPVGGRVVVFRRG